MLLAPKSAHIRSTLTVHAHSLGQSVHSLEMNVLQLGSVHS